jgi:pilus assembly protein CpaC
MNRDIFFARAPMARVIALALATTVLATAINPLDAKVKSSSAKAKPAKSTWVAHAAKAKPISAMSMGSAHVERPTNDITLSVGRGQLITLPSAMSDVFVSNENVADVQVRSANQIYVFAKAAGESTVYATSKSGAVVYSANIHSGQNVGSIDQMLRLAMPDDSVTATPMNGMVLLTGTVATPEDGAQAEQLVQAYVGDKIKVISRLRMATPLQVNLQVKIAEVSRSLVKEIGSNLMTRDKTGGFLFGVAQGRNFGSIGDGDLSALPKLDASSQFGLPPGTISLPFDPKTGQFLTSAGTAFNMANLAQGAGKTAVGLAGHLFGIDVASALDLAEREGLVTTLAQPNLTALSGETASFLAGGEIPIPLLQGTSNTVTVDYKQYGVSLSFTPIVLADGRISMRVRPEVSELSSNGAVTLNGFTVPALSTRRVETTVELGSGQAFMIGGLLSNSNNNSITKAPGLGDVPVLGAMFRSTAFQRNETELVIIVTPYLVKPVNPNQIALPTDGYKAASDLERVLLGRSFSGSSGGERPVPTMAPPSTVASPTLGAQNFSVPTPTGHRNETAAGRHSKAPRTSVAPGFSGN